MCNADAVRVGTHLWYILLPYQAKLDAFSTLGTYYIKVSNFTCNTKTHQWAPFA